MSELPPELESAIASPDQASENAPREEPQEKPQEEIEPGLDPVRETPSMTAAVDVPWPAARAPRAYGQAARSVVRALLSWTATLASAAVYATIIVTFGAQVARVEGHSMQPTLDDQDRLIVNKAAYLFSDPQPGDIVMLYEPDRPDRALVKRVIGEPGDVIRIVDGRVFRNNVELTENFVADEFRSHDDFPPAGSAIRQVAVRDGYYFVMGDHRNNSLDSRDFGEVPKKYILGKVPLRWWPLNHVRLFSAPAGK